MKITEDRFKSILAGTATNLTSKEILIRQEAFDAERRGQDPMVAVEAQMPDVTIVRREAYRGTVSPRDVLFEDASAEKAIASGGALHPAGPGSLSLFASIKLFCANLFRREPFHAVADATKKQLNANRVPPLKASASVGTAGSVDLSEHGRRPARAARKKRSRPSDTRLRRTTSQELVAFSERHGIPLDNFFDAAGMSKAEYARQMEAVGAIIAYNVTPCSRAGHSIRNRYGKCVVCDPKQIAFNQRAFEAGSVYAAFSPSKGLIKVGFTKDGHPRDHSRKRKS